MGKKGTPRANLKPSRPGPRSDLINPSELSTFASNQDTLLGKKTKLDSPRTGEKLRPAQL